MRNVLGRGLVFFSILVGLYGCMLQRGDENEGVSQEEVSTEELVARPPNMCVQPIKTGPCRAYFRRYAFDAAAGRCVQFVYGGCQGNANNFESYAACWHSCGRFASSL